MLSKYLFFALYKFVVIMG